MASLIVQEMIRATMYRLATKRQRPQSTKMEVLKVLYDAKNRLPVTNPYRDMLPYYWYRDGPFSDVVYNGLDDLTRSGLVKRNPGRYETYSLESAGKRPLMYGTDMDEARDAISDVVGNFVNIGDTRRNMYEGAPYTIYVSYRLKFEPKFESLCRRIQSGESGLNVENEIDILAYAASTYPKDAGFDEQWQPFGDFAVLATLFLMGEPAKFGENVPEKMKRLSESVWFALAAGIRIEQHDPHYDKNVPRWTVYLYDKLSELRRCIDRIRPTILKRTDRRTMIDAVRRLGMEMSADRLHELEGIANKDPDEDRIDMESMSRLAGFMLGKRLPEPDICAGQNGEAQAVWWPRNGIFRMDFGSSDTVEYSSMQRDGRPTSGQGQSQAAH